MSWAQIVTAVATIMAGLGGVSITQRHQRRLAAEALAEARRIEQRDALAAAIAAGSEWATARAGVIAILQAVQAGGRVKEPIDIEATVKAGREFGHLLIVAKLTVIQPRTRTALNTVSDLFTKAGTDAGSLLLEQWQTGQISPQRISAYAESTFAVGKALDALAAAAEEELPPKVAASNRHHLRQSLRRQRTERW